jgi:hypothetical protein
MTTPDLLNALADVIANLRGMYDDTDGETHMPREDSDEICKAVTGIAKSLGCKDDWGHVADALRAHATTLTPGLPEGWEWVEGSTTEAQSGNGAFGVHIVDDTVYIDGEAPAQAVRAVLARAGVVS